MSNTKSQKVCTWCRTHIETDVPYRTPAHAVVPDYPEVGILVCSPGCPDRPEDAIVYAYERHNYEARV